MERQNITLSIPKDLLQKVKIIAVKSNTSLSGLLSDYLARITNEEEAYAVFGIKAGGADFEPGKLDGRSYEDVAKQLHEKFGLKYVVITLRESISATVNDWSGMIYDGKRSYFSRKYHIDFIVDRVGGGDAFSSGVIYGLLTGMTLQETAEFAAAASCLKHSIHGDFNLVSKEEVFALMKGSGSGRIQR